MSRARKTAGAVTWIAVLGVAHASAQSAPGRAVRARGDALHHVHAQRHCKAAGADLVASNGYAQVLFLQDIVDSAVYVCPVVHGRLRRRVTLLEGSQSSQGGDPVQFDALTGRFVTVERSHYYGPTDTRTPTTETAIYDTRHLRRPGVEIGAVGFTLHGAKLTAAVAAGTACAWLETGRDPVGGQQPGSVRSILHARDSAGVHVLDSGRIPRGSVAIAGTVVSWLNAGVRRTAKLPVSDR